jgi:hypothetical protein
MPEHTWKPIAGKTTLKIKPVKATNRLVFVAETTCVQCGGAFTIRYGTPAAVFSIGNELVAVCCDACLDGPSRERLAKARETARPKVTQ